MLVPVVKVLVVEDHPLMAESVRALVTRARLTLLALVRTVAEAERVLSSLSRVERESLVAVIDVKLPDGSGLDLVRRWSPKGLRSVVFTGQVTARAVDEAWAASAMAFVAKTAPPQVLVDALGAVSRGERFLCQHAQRVLDAREQDPTLTARETEVLQLIGAGRSNKQIAQELGLASRTVESHRERLLSKLGGHNAADLTREAIRRGLLRID
jgi:DNA-binding NarL/FixJ family response regulator